MSHPPTDGGLDRLVPRHTSSPMPGLAHPAVSGQPSAIHTSAIGDTSHNAGVGLLLGSVLGSLAFAARPTNGSPGQDGDPFLGQRRSVLEGNKSASDSDDESLVDVDTAKENRRYLVHL